MAQNFYVEEAAAEKARANKNTYEWIQSLVSALILCVVIFLLFVRVIDVKGSSMLPTLVNGDKMIVSNLFYHPKAGDVIVLKKDEYDPNKALVKRIIATEGQQINMDFENGKVFIAVKSENENEKQEFFEIEEDYINEPTMRKLDFIGPKTVPEGCVFVMGDNRNASTDSRKAEIGMVDTRLILGKVHAVIFPTSHLGVVRTDGLRYTDRTISQGPQG